MVSYELAGQIAGVITLAAFIPYIVETLWGQVRPNRTTWIVWFTSSAILYASYRAAGAEESLWVPLFDVAGYFVLMFVALFRGEGGWSRFDRACLVIALAGLGLWLITDQPLLALILNLGVDAAGALPTVRKAWKDPTGESRWAWGLFSLGALVNLLAVDDWTSFGVVVYPVYFAIGITAIALLVIIRRRPRKKLEVVPSQEPVPVITLQTELPEKTVPTQIIVGIAILIALIVWLRLKRAAN